MDPKAKTSIHAKAVTMAFFSKICKQIVDKPDPTPDETGSLHQKLIALNELANQIKTEIEAQ